MKRLLVALALLGATTAGADPVRCQRAIVKASAKHAQAVAKTLERCAAGILAGRLPPSTDCTADPALAIAQARLDAAVARACCGDDETCGTPDDEPLAGIGWDVGSCPDFETLGCDDAIGDSGDVASCLGCLARAGEGSLLGLTGGGPSACTRAIGKERARYLRSVAKALARCWDARSRGVHANACPDGAAGETIARALAKLGGRITTACAGVAPGDVTALEHCPDVTVPDGASCAQPIGTLDDVVFCLGCVATFTGVCVDHASVPGFTAYPAACNPPPGSCTAGVQCETALDCPTGHGCRDNGGGTRYCVGDSCSGDGDCGGGSVCRQYCTTAGCEPPRCQCPGFGCTGPDELCLDDGGLGCRKLCTQDSDCTDPFGLVCVNPGFGFGVCIGQSPCQ